MPPRISIIIRCYNEEEHIGKLLTGIIAQSFKDYEIILVDSGSTDATLAIANRFPVAIQTISPEEFSFGRSLNLGCAAARGELLVFASAHVYPVYPDWLEQLIKPFDDPLVALTYGKQRGDNSTRFSEKQVFASWFPEKSDSNQSIPFCNNANAAVRRAIWQQMPYDERLTGLEDLDWAHRAIQQGYRIAYSAEAEIVHLHEETPDRIYNRYRREAMAMKVIFPSQHFNLWDFIRLLLHNIIADSLAARHERRAWRELPGICSFRFWQFWGTYQGFSRPKVMDRRLKQQFYYPNQPAHPVEANETSAQRLPIDYSAPD